MEREYVCGERRRRLGLSDKTDRELSITFSHYTPAFKSQPCLQYSSKLQLLLSNHLSSDPHLFLVHSCPLQLDASCSTFFSFECNTMRPEANSLDLNNLPEEHGKQLLEESSMTTAASVDAIRFKKKKSQGKDDSAKVYECRFCSLKFCKSQALGGHMNRHRQGKETETLNRARQLVFSNEGLAGAGAMGYVLRDLNLGGSQIPPRGFQHGGVGSGGNGIGEPFLPFRPVYPTLPTQPNTPPMQQYIYPSSSHSLPYPAPSYQPARPAPVVGNYYIGHVVSGSSQCQPHYGAHDPSFTCYGTPLTHSFPVDGVRAPNARDGAPRSQNR
ncbi:zinc finger protein STAMENLESS 1-like [Canna indica]|uniref:Zinc finger protein STAMENLESS 1-like n=1 Tax=Canna indica TaxID=4628 RepID=A0AAQ3Q5Y0_9LILI|nr:zinc finger protein STAMENLESS 1-like [Canna indica]